MSKKRILGVIGLGHVGAHAAYALAVQGIADELILVDKNAQKLASEVQDLRDAAAQAFCALSGYQELTAVKEGRVYGVDANTSSRPGPRITLALIDFARAISGTK